MFIKKTLLALLALFLLNNISDAAAATFSQTPQEVIDYCNNLPSDDDDGSSIAMQTYKIKAFTCIQDEIKKRLIILKGQKNGEQIANQVEDMRTSVTGFYRSFTGSNKYCEFCGHSFASFVNLTGYQTYLEALLFRISDLPANYADRYTKEVDEKSSVISECQHQENCIIKHLQTEMNKGILDYDLEEEKKFINEFIEKNKKIYNNIYSDEPDKATAAFIEDLEYFLRRLLYLNLTKEGY